MLCVQSSPCLSAEKPFAAGQFVFHRRHDLVPCSSKRAGAFPHQGDCLGPLESHCTPMQESANTPLYAGQILSSSSGQVSCEDPVEQHQVKCMI